jgi:predicted nucleotidyltransferase
MVGVDLERVFRTPAQIAVLRALWKAPASLTGRQVQHLAGVHNRTAMQCLDDLEQLGLVQRRTAGRAYLYTLKRSHRVVQDLVNPSFEAEREIPRRLREQLAKVVEGACLSAVLYGSVARNEEQSSSDVDLLAIVRNKEDAQAFAEGTQAEAERRVRDEWGSMLEVNVMTVGDLRRQWNTRLMKQIRREGQLVAGSPLEELHRGRRS